MKIGIVGTVSGFDPFNGGIQIAAINERGYEEIEINSIDDLIGFSFDKSLRICGIGKKGTLYKLTKKSWTELRKIYHKRGDI